MKNFKNTNWLEKHLNDENILIVDCRSDLVQPELGIKAYEEEHIPGAVLIDLPNVLASEIKEHGGRHPLPSVEDFKSNMEKLGINNKTTVIAYDDLKIAGAARLCWMLRVIGHEDNYVLDGGINKWISEDRPLESGPSKPKKSNFPLNISLNEDLMASMEVVKDNIDNEKALIIDSRANKRYLGIHEPIDKFAGHIKNAVNFHWKQLLNEDFSIDMEKIKESYKGLNDYDNIFIYCGSGIDATFNFLLLDELGIESKVYTGSWSDWITYPENKEYMISKK